MVFDVSYGQIAVTPETIKLKVKRPLLAIKHLHMLFAFLPILLLLIILMASGIHQLFKVNNFTIIWGILILPYAFMALVGIPLPRQYDIARHSLASLVREGRKITLLFEPLSPLRGITFLAPSIVDAIKIEHALTEPNGNLATPVRFVPNPHLNSSKTNSTFDFIGDCTIAFDDDGIRIDGSSHKDDFKRKIKCYEIASMLLLISLGLVGPLFADIVSHDGQENLGWLAAILMLLSIIGLYGCAVKGVNLRLHAQPINLHPLSMAIANSSIKEMDRFGNFFILKFIAGDNQPKEACFSVFNRDDGNIIEATLQNPVLHTEDSYAMRFQLSAEEHIGHSYYGDGQLLLDGPTVSFTGKRTDNAPTMASLKVPFGLLYAGIVYLMYTLYPVLFGDFLPVGFKGIIVLLSPLPVVVAGYYLFSIVQLFATCTRTFLIHEVTGFRRLGRQITLYAPDETREVQKYVFHTRTMEEAEAIEQALTQPGEPGSRPVSNSD